MSRRIRQKLSFSNVIAVVALFIALGGSAYAVGKNTVGTKQLKKNAVTTSKIKKNAVTTAKVKSNAITGAKVKESSLGTVPSATKAGSADSATTAGSATTAASADSLVGQEGMVVKMSAGQTKTLATNGSVSITAECVVNDGGSDRINLYENTTQAGAVANGDDDWSGGTNPNDFLNPDTLKNEREFLNNSGTTGEPDVDTYIDNGYILGPDGKMITTNSEGIALGLNYLGSPCVVAGVFNMVG